MSVSKKPAKIVFLIDTIECDTAGTQKQLIQTVRRLNRTLYEPFIICLYSSPWMDRNVLPCPVAVLGYQGFIKLSFIPVVLKLRTILRKESIQIVQTFFEDSIFVAFFATLGLGRPHCVLLSSRRDIGLGGNRPWYHKIFSFVLPYVNRYFDGIVCNGMEVKKWVSRKERVPLQNIHVVPNGTALPLNPSPPPELFLTYAAPLWIGLVASLTPVKRIDVFLKALRKLTEMRPDVAFRAVILGEGPEREALTAMTLELELADRVHFPGAVPEVSPFLHRLDIGVLCSDREGFSNAVLEYMAHSLPVVVTSVGGNLELVDQEVGFCVPAGDVDALAEALILLADSPALRTQLGARGLARVRESYSWERSMSELECCYAQILSTRDGCCPEMGP